MLDTKKMHVSIKNNKTAAEIMKELNISSEDEFEHELRLTYTSEASYGRIKRALEKNEKLKGKRKTASKTATEDQESKVNETVDVVDAETPESTETISVPAENPTTLEEVMVKIDETIANLNGWERKHKNAFSNRVQIRSRLEVKKSQLLKLEESVKLIIKEVESLRVEYNAEEAHMKEYTELINSAKSELIDLNTKREALETLFILIYPDGIEINNEMFDQVPESWEHVYEKIRDDERLDFLRVKEQKTLAKFIALQWVLPAERKQELCFDSSEMEAAYELIKKQFINHS